jgi:hypothetical protein
MPGLEGTVNTMEAVGNYILLGGSFSYNNDMVNAIAWSSSSWFLTFTNKIANEVTDFQKYNDTLYAACKRTSTTDSLVFLKLKNNTWEGGLVYDIPVGYSINTLCLDGNKLRVGGDIVYNPMMGTNISNAVNFSPPYITGTDYMLLDSTVNKMVLFKGALFAGGRFKSGNGWSGTSLNGIARQTGGTAVHDLPVADLTVDIYPNPISKGRTLTIRNSFKANHFTLSDINGRTITEGAISNATEEVNLPSLAAGNYLLEIKDNANHKATRNLLVK